MSSSQRVVRLAVGWVALPVLLLVTTLSGTILAQPYTLLSTIRGFGSASGPSGPIPNNIGNAVAIQGDVAFVGAYQEQAQTGLVGRVYVYARTGTTWTAVQTLSATGGSNFDQFGWSLDVDGDTLVVGAPNPNGTTGAAYVFVRSGGSWVQQARLDAAPPVRSYFGWSVAVSGDTVVVGATGGGTASSQSTFGQVHVFVRSGTTWSRQDLPSPPNVKVNYGVSVDVSGDAVCVGDPNDSQVPQFGDIRGNVWVYSRSGGTWVLQQRVQPTDVLTNDAFGWTCAIDGDTLVGTSYRGTTRSVQEAGAAYAFTRSGSTWSQQQKLEPAGTFGASNRIFGALSLRQGVVVVGSRLDNGSTGAFDIFTRAGATWTHTQRTPNVTPGGAIQFGAAVAFDGSTLLVGANEPGSSSVGGRVHVFGAQTNNTGAPGPPSGLLSTIAGSTVNFSWSAPTSGGAPTGYSLVAGLTPGFTAPVATVPLPAAPLSASIPNVPAGTYFARLLATNANGSSAPSNEIAFTVGGVAAPNAPTLAPPSVTGTSVSFSWTPAASGGAAASYVLTAASSPGGAPIATVQVGGTSQGFAGVPPGTYYVRVTAVNAAGSSAPSNEVTAVVAGATAPAAPILSPATVSGSTVTLSWSAGSGGGAPTSFVLTATVTPSGSPVATVPVGGTTQTFGGVPSGTYFVRITAVNAAGSSPPSNQVTVVVP